MAFLRLVVFAWGLRGVLSSQLHAFSFAFSWIKYHTAFSTGGTTLDHLLVTSRLKGRFWSYSQPLRLFPTPFWQNVFAQWRKDGGQHITPKSQSKSTHVPPRLSSHNNMYHHHNPHVPPRLSGHHDGHECARNLSSGHTCCNLKETLFARPQQGVSPPGG